MALAMSSPSVYATPHIIQFMADDLGRNDLGIFNGGKTLTPNIDELIRSGTFLTDFHTFKICAPSRASTMTGRYPFNVGFYAMPSDDENQCAANYTHLPALLKDAGYSTHALGKWDVGYIVKECTPTYRGFDTFLGYYKACNADLFYHNTGACNENATGHEMDMSHNNGTQIGGAKGINGTYSTRAFTAEALRIIRSHDASTGPLYMYIAPQNVHLGCGKNKKTEGIQAPCETVSLYPRVANDTYKVQSAVTTELDYIVGNVTQAMKDAGFWNDTLVTFASDNGGPLDHTTNYPLRGGKHTFWDGGLRVVSFVSGPVLPEARRGTNFTGIAHSSDWYATLVEGVAGGKIPQDTGPMPPDSVNLWPAISQGSESPRTEVIHQVENDYFSEGVTAMRSGNLKLILGKKVGDSRTLAWPELSDEDVPYGKTGGLIEQGTDHCRSGPVEGTKKGDKECPDGCLFDLVADPGETNNLINDDKYADAIKEMTRALEKAGREAPPVNRYFPEPEPYKSKTSAICAASVQTGFVEPLDLNV